MNRNFKIYTIITILLPFAGQAQSLTLGWQIYELLKDPFYLGLIGLVEAVPALSLALVAGYIVDQRNPLKIFRHLVLIEIFSSLLMLFTLNPWFPLTQDQKIASIYFVAFLAGLNRGFRMPSRTALVPLMVTREDLAKSSAWSTAGFAAASSVGPATAGFLYAWIGPEAPYILNLILQLTAFVLWYQIHIHYVKATVHKAVSAFENITAGIRFVFSNQLLLGALALDMFAVLFGGAVALLPVFAGEILHVGPEGLGILRASSSVGAVIGSLIMIQMPGKRRAGEVLFGSVVGFGLCMIGFGLSTSFWLSVAFLTLGGALDSISMVIRAALVQLAAPSDMRGRVGAVNSMFIGVSNQLGEFESGLMAKLMGTATSVVFGGCLTLAVVVITAIKAPRLRKLDLDRL